MSILYVGPVRRAIVQDLPPSIEERVRGGALFLDEHLPGWSAQIAADELAMETCDRCILGQLYGDYEVGFKHLVGKFRGPLTFFRVAAFGFTLTNEEQEEAIARGLEPRAIFAALADAWRREVRERVS
jgi:hypothetical protein